MLLKSLENEYLDQLKILREKQDLILMPVSLDGVLSELFGQAVTSLKPNIRNSYIKAVYNKTLIPGKVIFIKNEEPKIIMLPISAKNNNSVNKDYLKKGIEKVNKIIKEEQINSVSINISKWDYETVNFLKELKDFKIKIYDYNELVLDETV